MKLIKIPNQNLVRFLKSTKFHFNKVDEIMAMPASLQRDSILGKEMNRFNFDFDQFAHISCNVPLNKLQSILNKSFKTL